MTLQEIQHCINICDTYLHFGVAKFWSISFDEKLWSFILKTINKSTILIHLSVSDVMSFRVSLVHPLGMCFGSYYDF
jgi:hypothetical protein